MRLPKFARSLAAIALHVAVLCPGAVAAQGEPVGGMLLAPTASAPWTMPEGHAQDPVELYRVRIDTRLCPAPFCGGAFVSRVNLSETLCPDGEYRDACYVTRIDLDPVELTDPQLSYVFTALNAGQAVVGGRIEQTFSPTWGLAGEFRATEVWRAATDSVEPSVIFRARDNGIRCIAAPCFSYDLVVVNTWELMTVSELNLSNVGTTAEMLAAANEAQYTLGLLVVGTMHEMPRAGPAGDGRLFDVTQFYIPVTRGIIIPPIR